jgi:dCTP deaminase
MELFSRAKPPVILTGPEIRRQVLAGAIVIEPFSLLQLNPNSYNYRLGSHMRALMSDAHQPVEAVDLRAGPVVLQPGTVYLGHTLEIIGSNEYVTLLNGRSSMGRLGLFLNFSADLGHLGPAHKWTLEMKVVQPLRVHYGMKVGQASFWIPEGRINQYVGEYAQHSDPTQDLRFREYC